MLTSSKLTFPLLDGHAADDPPARFGNQHSYFVQTVFWLEMRLRHNCSCEVGVFNVGAFEVGSCQDRSREVCTPEVGALEVGVCQDRSCEVCAPEVGALKVGSDERCA